MSSGRPDESGAVEYRSFARLVLRLPALLERCFGLAFSCWCGHKPGDGEYIVGQGKPLKHSEYLLAAANVELAQAPVAETGIHTFGRCPALINALAVRALHAPAPCCHSRPVISARHKRIGLMLAVRRWAVGFSSLGRSP